jgi:hypothetical protein
MFLVLVASYVDFEVPLLPSLHLLTPGLQAEILKRPVRQDCANSNYIKIIILRYRHFVLIKKEQSHLLPSSHKPELTSKHSVYLDVPSSASGS